MTVSSLRPTMTTMRSKTRMGAAVKAKMQDWIISRRLGWQSEALLSCQQHVCTRGPFRLLEETLGNFRNKLGEIGSRGVKGDEFIIDQLVDRIRRQSRFEPSLGFSNGNDGPMVVLARAINNKIQALWRGAGWGTNSDYLKGNPRLDLKR